MSAIRDACERLERAAHVLCDYRDDPRTRETERVRLGGKIEGVKLALSYLEEGPQDDDVVQAAAEYVALVARIHTIYRNLVMDTAKDREIHARHVAVADDALSLVNERLAALGARVTPLGPTRCWCGGEVGPRDPGDANGLGCLEDINHAYDGEPPRQCSGGIASLSPPLERCTLPEGHEGECQ